MGTRKKSKKARSRSRSRSRDSDYSDKYRGSRSKRSSRRRSSSHSSSSDSRGDRYRSRSRTPEKRRKKRSKRRSRSRSRSRQRRKSRSRSRERSHKLGSRSKDNSGTSSPATFREQQVKETAKSPDPEDKPVESLQEKMKKALEAAANADAQLREQGILPSKTKNEILTEKEEKDRQKKLAAIEKEGFRMQSFQSSAQTGKTNQAQQPVYGISRDLNHDSAIFSTTDTTILQNTAKYLDSVQPKRNGKLASDFLSASKEEKEERWFQKLKALRKQRLEGKPVPTQNKTSLDRNDR